MKEGESKGRKERKKKVNKRFSSSRGEGEGVRGVGHRFRCFDAFLGERLFNLLFSFCNLAEVTQETLLRRSFGRKAGKRERVMEEKRGFVCCVPTAAAAAKTAAKKVKSGAPPIFFSSTAFLFLFTFSLSQVSPARWRVL